MTVAPDVEARAAAKVPILSRVIETASLPEIRDQFRGAVVAGDTASCYLFASLLPGRLAGDAPVGQATARPEVDAARAEIGRLIGQVRDDLRDPSADPVRRLAGAVLERASVARQAAAQQARFDSGEKVRWPRAS